MVDLALKKRAKIFSYWSKICREYTRVFVRRRILRLRLDSLGIFSNAFHNVLILIGRILLLRKNHKKSNEVFYLARRNKL